MAEEFETDSSVRGYHVYQDNWTPVVGEQLLCEWEEGNLRDRYAEQPFREVGIVTVGHVPRNIPKVCSLLADHCDVSVFTKIIF